MNRQSQDSIETLKEILGLLRITKDYALDGNRTTEVALEEMLMAPAPAPAFHNELAQTVILKSMVPDSGWFDGD